MFHYKVRTHKQFLFFRLFFYFSDFFSKEEGNGRKELVGLLATNERDNEENEGTIHVTNSVSGEISIVAAFLHTSNL